MGDPKIFTRASCTRRKRNFPEFRKVAKHQKMGKIPKTRVENPITEFRKRGRTRS